MERYLYSITRIALASLALLAFIAMAQPPQTQIEVLVDEVENEIALTEERRANLLDMLQEAARALQSASQWQSQQESLTALLTEGDAQISDYEAKVRDMQRAPASVERRLGDSPTLEEIEAEINDLENQRGSWNRDRSRALEVNSDVASEDTQRRDRLGDIVEQLQDLGEARVDENQPDLEQQVRTVSVGARRFMLEEEEALIQLQQRAAPTVTAIRTAKIAWLDAAIAEADALLMELQSVAAQRRQTAVAQRRAETRRLVDGLDNARPELASLAEQNLASSNEFQRLGDQIEATRSELASLRLRSESIEQDANLTRRRLGVAGLESELGAIMLTRLESLPDPRLIGSRLRERNKLIGDLSISAIDTEQSLRALGDPMGHLRGEIDAVDDWSADELRAAVQLLEQRRRILQDNLEAENTLLRLLVDGNQAAEDLIAAADDYENFLTANLLWVRTYSFASAERLRQQMVTLLTAAPLDQVTAHGALFFSDPYFLATIVVLAFVLLRRRRIADALLDRLGSPIRPRDESAALIFRALVYTLLLSLPVPLLLVLLARLHVVLFPNNPVATGIAVTLQWAAVAVFSLYLVDRMAGRLGAGRRLLKWNGLKLDVAVRDLPWLTPVVAIAILIFGLGRASSPADSGASLSALGSAIMVIALLAAALRMHGTHLFETEGLVRGALRFCILACVAIGVMHVSGQLFAAHLYLIALVGSIAAVLLVLLLSSILQRVLLINQANLERKAKEDLRAQEAEPEDTAEEREDAGSNLDTVTSLSEAYSNLLALARILALGTLLWLIWSPALPALEIFDAVTLWSSQDPSLPAGELHDVTLSVLLMALLILIVTVLVTKHLPPLINVLLMEWSSVSAGGRYATGMLTQYVVIGVGVSVSLGLLGFQWSKVQWLVAALGVGIGFGLQEIVANFISGLILLFERPIRVGDVINAGGHDGTVVNINPRATVIQTFERKEVMIPNKELITSVVTNWSLSDTQLRVLIPVGVSYGSDVGLAMRTLLEIARQHADVLDDPEPMVTFEDFGDNALMLWLRCYASADYLRVATELRELIYNRMNEEGIGIAFPQRDVHLDAQNPIPIRVLPQEQ